MDVLKKCTKSIWLMMVKVRLKIRNRSHRYNIIRPRHRYGNKYTKYKIYLSMMKFICIKQHLNNVWGSIHEKGALRFCFDFFCFFFVFWFRTDFQSMKGICCKNDKIAAKKQCDILLPFVKDIVRPKWLQCNTILMRYLTSWKSYTPTIFLHLKEI